MYNLTNSQTGESDQWKGGKQIIGKNNYFPDKQFEAAKSIGLDIKEFETDKSMDTINFLVRDSHVKGHIRNVRV